MPRLVTQAVSEQVRIALIGSASTLRSSLQSFFERHGFGVDSYEVSSFITKHENEYYKVILLDGWQTQKPSQSDSVALFNALIARLREIALSSASLTLIQEYDPRSSADDSISQDAKRAQLESLFPEINSILVQDAVILHDTSWWWQLLTQSINNQILVDYQMTLYPFSLAALLTTLQSLLLKPQTHARVVIRGKEQSMSTIAAEVQRQYQLYFQTQLLIKQEQSLKIEDDLVTGYQPLNLATEPLPSLLQTWVQQLPSPLVSPKQSKPVATPAPLKHAKVTPVAIPKIKVPEVKKREAISQPPVAALIETKKIDQPSVDEQLQSLFSTRRVDQKTSVIKEKVVTNQKVTKKNKKRSILFLGGLALTGASLGVLVLAGIFVLNEWFVWSRLLQQLKQPDQASSSISKSMQSALQVQTEAYELFLPDAFFDGAHEALSLSQEWQEVQKHLAELEKSQISVSQIVLGKAPLLDIPTVNTTAFESLSRLYSRLTTQAKASDKPSQQQALLDYAKYLDARRTSLITYQQLSPLFPQLFGIESKRTYALLLQNEQELRPTGGFLQAVAIITLDKGQIIDSQVFSSYELDERLQAVVTPPDDLKKVLNEQRWYLRDSNWNPDFSESSKQISWFLEQQLNRKIDGVIGMNIGVMQSVLRTLGPLELSAYNELLTDKNLQERMEFHSEVKLVASDKTADYSATVLKAFLSKIMMISADKSPTFLSTLGEELAAKNLIIHLTNENENATLALLGWNGALMKPNCPTPLAAKNCVVDTLAVIDSNVGVNKANFHIKRAENHFATLSSTQILHKHTITFENISSSNAWPKGAYQSYLRILLDSKASLTSIVVNDRPLSASELTVSQAGAFLSVGFLSTTPIQTKSTITVDYTLPVSLAPGDSYSLFVQKQPGIEQPLSSVAINLASNFKPNVIAPQADVEDQTILFHDMPKGHVFTGINLK